MRLEKYNGKSFEFAEDFVATVTNGVVYVEQFADGEFPLEHIKTESQFIELYEILTGEKWSGL